jgi:hypothetical protein
VVLERQQGEVTHQQHARGGAGGGGGGGGHLRERLDLDHLADKRKAVGPCEGASKDVAVDDGLPHRLKEPAAERRAREDDREVLHARASRC